MAARVEQPQKERPPRLEWDVFTLLPAHGPRHRVLAGYESLTTTQQYMHRSPAAKDAAISLQDEAAPQISGDIPETGIAPKQKPGR
ncbi:hypothetical protein [Hyalangium sp.]|uniref:hypothetical protein n=1 Tax=Hyalangium sp. TaxID=2028555 RepID=UPI002D4EF22F|nr:hypothetical protein [Hyalangium sp.]HYI02239.1 hypothetical protein [Hyalangium sp.]